MDQSVSPHWGKEAIHKSVYSPKTGKTNLHDGSQELITGRQHEEGFWGVKCSIHLGGGYEHVYFLKNSLSLN